ncbi:hypothetical protein R3W88_001386 [Solanum pinnatisectum]|uniref:Uncharacterized protein n=1 Tax=Solanum pinnatisectum TaxID=50273 RepID=A0AAV9MKY3_9SOLN|nr:hypothetical protein R3W88_001386 [Solanum pinnatisectum]
MIDNRRGWHEVLSYALLGYRTTVRTSVGATPYMLVYGTEVVIPAEVEIPSLRIIQEAELSDAKWVPKLIDQLTMIDKKRMVVVCHGQLYRQRMIRAFSNKVRARMFEVGQLVLKRIFPHQDEYKGTFTQIGKDLTWFEKCFPQVPWSCQRWTALNGRNRSTQMLSRDIMCKVPACISVISL